MLFVCSILIWVEFSRICSISRIMEESNQIFRRCLKKQEHRTPPTIEQQTQGTKYNFQKYSLRAWDLNVKPPQSPPLSKFSNKTMRNIKNDIENWIVCSTFACMKYERDEDQTHAHAFYQAINVPPGPHIVIICCFIIFIHKSPSRFDQMGMGHQAESLKAECR